MEKQRKSLTPEEAEKLLPDGDTIHTFRGGSMLVGADWSRTRILERIKTNGVELSGDLARSMNHGICSYDEANGWLYIETRRTK